MPADRETAVRHTAGRLRCGPMRSSSAADGLCLPGNRTCMCRIRVRGRTPGRLRHGNHIGKIPQNALRAPRAALGSDRHGVRSQEASARQSYRENTAECAEGTSRCLGLRPAWRVSPGGSGAGNNTGGIPRPDDLNRPEYAGHLTEAHRSRRGTGLWNAGGGRCLQHTADRAAGRFAGTGLAECSVSAAVQRLAAPH